MEMVPAGEVESTALEARAGMKPAAVKHPASAMKGCAASMETASTETTPMERATMESATPKATATVEATTVASSAMTDFNRHAIGRGFTKGHRTRIDQRRFSALTGDGRQRHGRDGCKCPATDGAAPGIWNRHHV